MATAVQIQISVDSSQAVAGVQQVKNEFDGFSMVMSQGDQDAQRLAKSMDLTGTHMKVAGAGALEMGGHFQTSLDSVRLLSQEFGFRMPRAIESMLARMPAVTGALNGMIGVMAGVAGIEIFTHAIKGATALYERLFDVNAAMVKYTEAAGKAATAKFIDEAPLETAHDMLVKINSQIDQLDAKRKDAGVDQPMGGFLQYFSPGAVQDRPQTMAQNNPIYSASDGIRRAQLAAQEADTASRNHELQTQYDMEDLNLQQKKLEAGLKDDALIAQQKKDAHAVDALQQKQTYDGLMLQQKAMQALRDLQTQMGVKGNDLVSVPTVDSDAGKMEQSQKDAAADADAYAKRLDLASANANKQREAEEEIARYRHEASEAGLSDEALLQQKRLDDIADLETKMKGTVDAASVISAGKLAIDAKYYADVQKLADDTGQKEIEAQNRTAEAIARYRVQAMPEGADKIRAQHDLQVNENNVNLSGDERSAANQAAQATMDQGLSDLKKKQDDEEETRIAKINDLETEYATHSAEAQRRVRRDGLDGWVADYQDAMTSIQAQDYAETQKLMTNAAALKMSFEEVARAKANIDQQANDQIEEQAEELQHKLSGLMESAFKDPIGTIKSTMEKLMFDILAGWITQLALFKHVFGSTMGSIAPGSGGQGGGGIGGAIVNMLHGSHAATINGSSGKVALSSMGAHTSATSIGSDVVGGISSARNLAGIAGVGAGAGTSSTVSGTPDVSWSQTGFGAQSAQQTLDVGTAHTSAASIGSDVAGGISSARNLAGMAGVGAGAGTSSTVSGTPDVSWSQTGFGAPLAQKILNVGSAHTSAASIGSDVVGGISSARNLAGMAGFGAGAGTSSTVSGTPDVSWSQTGFGAPLAQKTLDVGTAQTDANGNVTMNMGGVNQAASATSGALSKGLGYLGAAGAGYMAEQTTVSAYKKGSMLSGAMGDAAAGATIGSLGGPLGIAIGAGVGAAVGFAAGAVGAIEGMPGKLAARSYYEKTLFPEIESDRTSQDPMSAISDINRAAAEGFQYMSMHFGASAAAWVRDNYLNKEVKLALGEVSQHAGGGEQYTRMNSAQFHTGGYIDGFGDLGTSSNEGYIHAMLGESVMNRQATSLHAPVINAMNSGATASDVASMYLANAKSNGGGAAPQQGGDTHFHIHTLDTKTMTGWLRGGGARMITKEQNNMTAQYAGDGVIG